MLYRVGRLSEEDWLQRIERISITRQLPFKRVSWPDHTEYASSNSATAAGGEALKLCLWGGSRSEDPMRMSLMKSSRS